MRWEVMGTTHFFTPVVRAQQFHHDALTLACPAHRLRTRPRSRDAPGSLADAQHMSLDKETSTHIATQYIEHH